MALYGAIRLAQIAIRYRKIIYKVLTAQDRVVGSAWRRGGYSKAAQYGVRSGAGIGTLTAPLISNFADDSPGNELQKPVQKRQQPTARKPYKTRGGFTGRSSSRNRSEYCPSKYNRYSNTRRYR